MKRILSFLMPVFFPVLVHAQYIISIAGNGTSGYSGDGGAPIGACIDNPQSVFADASANIYFSELGNSVIRRIDHATNVISTVAGNGTTGYSGDGGPATASVLYSPEQIFVNSSGIYFADAGNHVIRKINLTTGVISTIAGNGTAGYTGDGGQATDANLGVPFGVCLDNAGNIFIADAGQNVVRKVDAGSGIITTVAGTGMTGFSGDGGAAAGATLNNPSGIFIDAGGDLYIADSYNNRIRKVVASTGVINTIAGYDSTGYAGDGGPATAARLYVPSSVFVDGSFNVYITGSNVIRKITASTGIIHTIAGNGIAGFSGDNGPATSAQLYGPSGFFILPAGKAYIADAGNNRIRKLTDSLPSIPSLIFNNNVLPQDEISVFPNPAHDNITISNASSISSVTISNLLGQVVKKTTGLPTGKKVIQIDISGLPAGVYFIRMNGLVVRKFVKE